MPPEPPRETADQALRRIGVTAESLNLLAWKALDDALARHGAFLERDRKEEAHSFLVEAGLRVAIRYDPAKANGLAPATVIYRRLRLRYVDWLRLTLGDTRYPRVARPVIVSLEAERDRSRGDRVGAVDDGYEAVEERLSARYERPPV